MSQYKITQDQIRQRTVPKTFSRGEDYYHGDAISNPVKRGDTIEAQCAASSQPYPYQVRATLGEDGIEDATCSCEYDWGGDCKHIVALLLTYLNEPDLFEEQMPVEDILAERSKEELIALIRKMVKQYPDLQTLVNRPTPKKNASHLPVDTSGFRKEIKRAFTRIYRDGEHVSITRALKSAGETAQEFASFGDWKSASAIYRAILEEFMSADPDVLMHDEDGYLFGDLEQYIDELAGCLNPLAEDDTERKTILNTLIEVFVWGDTIEYGDVGVNIPDHVLRYAKPDDLPAIREKVLVAKKRRASKFAASWAVEHYAEFLAGLDAIDHIDPEVTLNRLREEGMYRLLAEKLLQMGRKDEAVQVVEDHMPEPRERLTILGQFVEKNHIVEAIQLAEKALFENYERTLMFWLLNLLQAQGDRQRSFRWLLHRMQMEPGKQHYEELKAIAIPLGNWDSLRPELIKQLEKSLRFDVLTQIYLVDEEWENAWKALAQIDKVPSTFYWMTNSLEWEVAQKARFATPEKSLPIYLRYIDRKIAERNRDAYQYAAHSLREVRDLYKQLGETTKWEILIQKIKTDFKRLPALQDELRQAGL